jgi:hypothetical protein
MGIFEVFRKPKVAPPASLDEPDTDALSPLIEKYESLLDSTLDSFISPAWVKYKKAFDDVIFLNFQSISAFMDNEVYMGEPTRKQELEKNIKTATTYAASCGWIVGREWATNFPVLHARLKAKSRIGTDDIPSDAMVLLQTAGYLPYYLFALIFTDYYDSDYGQRTRHQKDAHLKDTYQSIMNGTIMCFLEGVKSVA